MCVPLHFRPKGAAFATHKTTTVRTREKLAEYLNICAGLNQREFIGCSRLLLRGSLHSEMNLHFALCFLRCVHQHGLAERFEVEFGVCLASFDEALDRQFMNMKKDGKSIQEFLQAGLLHFLQF